MVRNYKRKTNRGLVSAEDVMSAVRSVKIDGVSLRKAAKAINISYGSLIRYVRKIPEAELYDKSLTRPSCSVGYNKKPRQKKSEVPGSSEGTQEIEEHGIAGLVEIKTEELSEPETEVFSVECDLLEMGDSVKHSEDSAGMDASQFDGGLAGVFPSNGGLGTSSQSEEKFPWKFQDEFEVSGWVVGTKLRSLHPIQRALAEKLIYDVLAKAVLEDLKPQTTITDS